MSALAKVVTVLQYDADHGIRHERLEVEPAFYAQLLTEMGQTWTLLSPASFMGVRDPIPALAPPSGLQAVAVWGPHGPVSIHPKGSQT